MEIRIHYNEVTKNIDLIYPNDIPEPFLIAATTSMMMDVAKRAGDNDSALSRLNALHKVCINVLQTGNIDGISKEKEKPDYKAKGQKKNRPPRKERPNAPEDRQKPSLIDELSNPAKKPTGKKPNENPTKEPKRPRQNPPKEKKEEKKETPQSDFVLADDDLMSGLVGMSDSDNEDPYSGL